MRKNLVYSVLGVLFQTLFPLIVYPYITRVLGVANLGEYNFYSSTVAYLSLLSSFGISLYGTKEIGKIKDNKSAYSTVFFELISINLLMSCIAYAIVICLLLFSPSYHNGKLFLITSITIVANAVGSEYLFVALEKQGFMLIRNICFKILSLVLIFLLVRDEGDLFAYAFIMMLSTAGVSITNISNYSNKIDWKALNIRIIHPWKHLIPLAQVFIMDILIHYYGMMDIVVLGNLDSDESVGYYSVASKIYALAYAILASTAVPLLPRAAYYLENKMFDEYKTMVRRCYDIYLLIIAFSSYILFFYAEDIVVLVSGESFRSAYMALKFFAPTLLLSSFCNFFIFEFFYPNNKNRLVLIGLIISIVINLILSLILIKHMSFVGAAIAFFASYIFLFIYFVFCGKKDLPRFTGTDDLVKELVGIIVCFFLGLKFNSVGIHLLIQLTVCSIVYIIIELLLHNNTGWYFIRLLINKIRELKNNNVKA